MLKIKLPTFECLYCGHRWHPKKEETPVNCAWCKSPRWNKAPLRPSKTRPRHTAECEPCRTADTA
jgi:hypothetical protein